MPRSIVIASKNLDSLDDSGAAERGFKARRAILNKELAALRADVLCLQEINPQELGGRRRLRALDRVIEGTDYESFHRTWTKGPDGTPLDIHNLVILSRHAIRQTGQVSHDLVPGITVPELPGRAAGGPATWDRPLLFAALDIGLARPLWVLDLHLRAPIAAHVPGGRGPQGWRSTQAWAEGFFRAALKRIGQALEVRLFLDGLFDADPQSLICVCGDFNAEGAEMPVRLIRADPEDTENPALQSRRLVALEEMGSSTIHGGHGMRPDHLLASPALVARHRRSGLLNRRLRDDTASGAQSTHAAILAEFRFPDR